MQKWMADLGRSMGRYLPTTVLDQLKQKPSTRAPRLVPDVSKSDDVKVSWSGGYSYNELVAMQRDKWPPKEQRTRAKKEALHAFYSRMTFMRDRRQWEKETSTSRLDPLFRTGVGAPVMRQLSTEVPSMHAPRPIAPVRSAVSAHELGRARLRGPPVFAASICSKARIASNPSAEIGVKGNSTSNKKRTAPLCMHKVKRLDPQAIWDGVQSFAEIQKIEAELAEKKEEEQRSITDEARTLFNMIDKDGSGSLDEVL